MYTYDALQCFEPETVKVFVYKKEWLKEKIKDLAGPDWGFISKNLW